MGYYYTIYPLSCNLAVTIGILNFFPAAFGRDLTMIDEASCRAIWFFRLLCVSSSIWVQAQMSVDCAVNVIYPKKFPWLQKPSNLAKITALIYVLSGLFASLHFSRFFVYKITILEDNSTFLAPSSCVLSDATQPAFSIVSTIQRVGSFLAVLISNIGIVRRLIDSKRALHRNKTHFLKGKEMAFAFSLVSLNFLTVVCVAPFMVIQLLQFYNSFNSNTARDYIDFLNIIYSLANWGNYLLVASPFYVNFSVVKQ